MNTVDLSREFSHRFWEGDTAWCCDHLAENLTWIGARDRQFGRGIAQFKQKLAMFHSLMPKSILSDEAYALVAESAHLHVVAGSYTCHTNPAARSVFAARQNVTFVWRIEGKNRGLVHLHHSIPADVHAGDGEEPGRRSHETIRYAEAVNGQQNADAMYELRDVQGILHLLRLADVMYLEASRQSTVVHCVKHSFRVRRGISDLAQTITGGRECGLVRVHRSYFVNALYVESISPDSLTVLGGTWVPLSSQRRVQATEEINRIRRAWGGGLGGSS